MNSIQLLHMFIIDLVSNESFDMGENRLYTIILMCIILYIGLDLYNPGPNMPSLVQPCLVLSDLISPCLALSDLILYGLACPFLAFRSPA